jgi:hypothetical protein
MDGEDLSVLLDRCLVDLQAGVPLETVLQKYPAWQAELRPILEAVISVWEVRGSDTVPIAAMTRSRARLMREALRKQEVAPKKFWERFGFQRLRPVPVATLLVLFSMAFTGLASAQALPGEMLYPVKMAAEQVGLNLPGSPSTYLERQESFDQRRVAEVETLIARQSIQEVNFSGYLTHAADQWSVAGINLSIPAEFKNLVESLNGKMVRIQADLTPDGKTIITGITPRLYTLSGKLNNVENSQWKIDDVWVEVDEQATPAPGQQVQVQVMRLADNHLQAVRIETDGHTYTDNKSGPSEPTETTQSDGTKSADEEDTQSNATPRPTQKFDRLPSLTPTPDAEEESRPTAVTTRSSSDDGDTKTSQPERPQVTSKPSEKKPEATRSEEHSSQLTPEPTKQGD